MDYFNDVLTTFLNLDHVILYGSLLSMEGQRALRIHQNILIFVLTIDQGLTDWNDMKVSNK